MELLMILEMTKVIVVMMAIIMEKKVMMKDNIFMVMKIMTKKITKKWYNLPFIYIHLLLRN